MSFCPERARSPAICVTPQPVRARIAAQAAMQSTVFILNPLWLVRRSWSRSENHCSLISLQQFNHLPENREKFFWRKEERRKLSGGVRLGWTRHCWPVKSQLPSDQSAIRNWYVLSSSIARGGIWQDGIERKQGIGSSAESGIVEDDGQGKATLSCATLVTCYSCFLGWIGRIRHTDPTEEAGVSLCTSCSSSAWSRIFPRPSTGSNSAESGGMPDQVLK